MTDPIAKAINEGENHYRQTVLGQGPLPGYPKIVPQPPEAEMFIGDNRDAAQAATQKLMDAAVHFRRAADSLMAAQAMTADAAHKEKLRLMRVRADSDSIFLDALFQEAAQRYFS